MRCFALPRGFALRFGCGFHCGITLVVIAAYDDEHWPRVVTLVGAKNMASAMAFDASRLYAKNVANLVALMTTDGTLTPDFDDEVVAGACLTHDGAVRHEPTAAALEAPGGTKNSEGKN